MPAVRSGHCTSTPQSNCTLLNILSFREGLQSAYNLIREAEQHAVTQYGLATAAAPRTERERDLISARAVGFYLIEFYSRRFVLGAGPASELAHQVTSIGQTGQDSNEVVFETGRRLCDHVLLSFRTILSDWSPSKSTVHPPPSFDTQEDAIQYCMGLSESWGDCDASSQRVVAREGFRCPITGTFSRTWIRLNGGIEELRQHPEFMTYGLDVVECCHILSESTVLDADSSTMHPEYDVNETTQGRERCKEVAAEADHVSSRFQFLDSLFNKLTAKGGVHHLSNLISLTRSFHDAFGNLDLWFDATDQPDRYRVRTVYPPVRGARKFFHDYVTFSVHSSEYGTDDLPLPDPQLLAMHAASSVVAQMSGAAAYYCELDDAEEESTVLASDGSSAPFLSALLTQTSPVMGKA